MTATCLRVSCLCNRLLSTRTKRYELNRTIASQSFSTDKETLIPPPTWSLQDLELSSSKEPVSMQELERLARKSLLDVSKLEDTDALRRDLSNMLHCLEQVRDTELPDLTDEEIYDVPRGVTAALLRNSSTDDFKEEEKEEAKQIWDSLLKPKAKSRGAHSYFSVITKRQVVSK